MPTKPYLFTLTISPVQGFIAQARKSQDLFAGSAILSQLMGKVLDEFKNDTVIFPQNKNALSNKIVVKLENKTEDEIKKIGKALEEKINSIFLNAIFKETKCYDSALKDFFQVFWVAVELEKDYKDSYKKLERNLGAVKNLRTFKQNSQASDKAKCVLCGERNWAKEYDKDKLCLVCATKRCDLTNHLNGPFPSLADIVTFDRKDKLNGQDAEAFLETNPSEKKHYALLHFDVDSLGKTLSGLNEQGQKDLSTVLGDFALKAKNIVDKSGRTIYAGGDDFLGFVNLAYLFDVMQKIKEAFVVENLTYSMGIVIAHYKEPLHIVLNRVRSVEKMAKEIDNDKNGLGISVLKHFGETLEARLKNTKENIQNLTQIIKLVEDYFSDKFIINLELEFKGLIDKDDKLMVKKEMLEVELKRLIKKSLLEKEQNNKVDELFILLTPFIEHRKVSNFFSLLNIVRFMKKGLK